MILSSTNRIHGYVVSHVAAKQLVDELELKKADENAARVSQLSRHRMRKR
jgi:hypothetical protein